jgi:hypothetical protein
MNDEMKKEEEDHTKYHYKYYFFIFYAMLFYCLWYSTHPDPFSLFSSLSPASLAFLALIGLFLYKNFSIILA